MTTHLIPLLDQLPGHRVLCVGDIMLDRYVYGQVERISPEAPIPVMRIEREASTLGGAGNVVRNIVALGGAVDLVGLIGQDPAGDDLSRIIASLPAITPYLLTDPARPTTIKTRFVANGQQLLRADHEKSSILDATLDRQILERVGGAIGGCDVVILSDYAKGVLSPGTVQAIITLARERKCRVLVDPKGRDFGLYRGASILTPNRKELTEATGQKIHSVADAEAAARALISAHQLDGVLAKLGADGVCIVMRDEPAVHFQVPAREVFDVSGAGDTVMATLALALAGGLSAAEAAELANIAGSIVVGKIGTATVSREDLAHELMHDENLKNESKIVSTAQASDIAERWRNKGVKVGFTNGCFDLLHPGHIALLRQARAACDKLFVGLNSDASVKRLKGETRPVQSELSRATVLASLADVDAVVIFDEDTPVQLIEAIRPAVLVKGADYTIDKVVGAELVQGWGGKVVLANLIDGQSTTKTIARLQGGKTA